MKQKQQQVVGTYIDLFSGCGGLSLGLGNAGWQGVFAVEKDEMAFETFKTNMLDLEGAYSHFKWPKWLPQEATTIQELLKKYPDKLRSLEGKVDLIAGGPPCQGFSLAGMRNAHDPRNKLSGQYTKMVEIIRPKYLLLENVRGFNAAFSGVDGRKAKVPQAMIVKQQLEKHGYKIFTDYVNCQDFGVPQRRQRFLMIGVREDLYNEGVDPFGVLGQMRLTFMKSKGLKGSYVSVEEAISDLELERHELIHHSGSLENGFKAIDYIAPKKLNPYQKIMRKGLNGSKPDSLRLPRHRKETKQKFKLVQKICRPGVALSNAQREKLGTKKQAITMLDPAKPSKTLTTLPDDIIHYSEPRILTVRESARIQSFPDDFKFKGKYTTGGMRRTKECPRYTQVGNAVPPLLGEVLGQVLNQLKKS